MVFASQVFTKRMHRLMHSMRNVWRDIPIVEIEYIDPNHDEIGQVTRAFAQMNVRLKDYIDRVYVAEIQRRDAEIQLLQHKINPHFLFNTLEAIRMKAIQGGQEEVSEMIAVLGYIYRWNVKGSGMFVRLEEELDYIRSYLYLMKLRYKDRIQIEYNIPDEILNYGIPKITLQPIVENAVKYGIDFESKGSNQITINGQLEGHLLILSIQDNGNGIELDRLYLLQQALNHEQIPNGNIGLGIANVHQRLRRLFGAEFGVAIDSFPGKGTLVTLVLPARTVKEMNLDVQGTDR
jgi:two-component system sensor histidine kinase YesM